MQRPIWWILTLSLVAAIAGIAGIAATAATPPNLTKAIETQRRLAAERPQDAGVYNDLGNLYLLAHRTAEAEEAYRRAVELDPEHGSATYNLALLLVEKGQRKEAFELFARVVEREPGNAWAHYQLGSIHEMAGRRSRAVAEYAQAFSLDPQLALPDVNPHVIDSKLTTEAMLEAYREGYGPAAAPKQWTDPSRIASILVPKPAEPKREDTTAGGAPEAAGPAARPGVLNPQAPAQGGRVLREGTIERGGNVGQATQPGVRRQPATPRQPIGGPGVRTWTRPDPGVEMEGDEGVVDDEEGGEVYTPPTPVTGYIYQPTLPSTGRIDLKVAPDRLAAGAAHPPAQRRRR